MGSTGIMVERPNPSDHGPHPAAHRVRTQVTTQENSWRGRGAGRGGLARWATLDAGRCAPRRAPRAARVTVTTPELPPRSTAGQPAEQVRSETQHK